MVPPYTFSGRWGPKHQWEQKRQTIRAVCRTFSCSEGYNLSSFKSLLPNPNLNVNLLAPRASHTESKSKILYPCTASFLPYHFHYLYTAFPVSTFPRCAWMSDLWCVCFLKIGSIQNNPPDNQSSGKLDL